MSIVWFLTNVVRAVRSLIGRTRSSAYQLQAPTYHQRVSDIRHRLKREKALLNRVVHGLRDSHTIARRQGLLEEFFARRKRVVELERELAQATVECWVVVMDTATKTWETLPVSSCVDVSSTSFGSVIIQYDAKQRSAIVRQFVDRKFGAERIVHCQIGEQKKLDAQCVCVVCQTTEDAQRWVARHSLLA